MKHWLLRAALALVAVTSIATPPTAAQDDGSTEAPPPPSTDAKPPTRELDTASPEAQALKEMLHVDPRYAKDGTVDRQSIWWLHEGNRALRAGNWKIVTDKDRPWELYDLSTDRSETKDLAKANPEKVEELAAMWTREFETYRALAAKDAPPPKKKGKAKKKE